MRYLHIQGVYNETLCLYGTGCLTVKLPGFGGVSKTGNFFFPDIGNLLSTTVQIPSYIYLTDHRYGTPKVLT
jgi:hypothetical protein